MKKIKILISILIILPSMYVAFLVFLKIEFKTKLANGITQLNNNGYNFSFKEYDTDILFSGLSILFKSPKFSNYHNNMELWSSDLLLVSISVMSPRKIQFEINSISKI